MNRASAGIRHLQIALIGRKEKLSALFVIIHLSGRMELFMIAYETRLGKIDISEAYLSKLIGHEVTSCFGVVGMVASSNRQKVFNIISRNNNLDTGIKVVGNADSITVELHIVVTYGMNINAIASSITEKVKYVVSETTGITVSKVTIKIDGIKE